VTDLTNKYGEIRRVLRNRLLWEKACIAQAADLPAPESVWLLALHLEVLRRLEDAKAQNDLARLHCHCETALRIVGS
jgi:hypothetical protein